MKHAALILAAALTLVAATSLRAETVDLWKTTPPYPDVVSTSHATPEAAAFFKSYFTAKSEHKPVPTTDHFSDAHLTYIDAALGWPFYSKKAVTEAFEIYMPKWPPAGLSYPTRISGDTHSALVAFTDTPELFGGEIRILGAIDFKDGKIVRWIDYWDGRSFGAEMAAKMRTPPDKFPTNFDYDVASDGASAKIKDVSQKLATAFAAGDAAAADALFTNDAVLPRSRFARAHPRQTGDRQVSRARAGDGAIRQGRQADARGRQRPGRRLRVDQRRKLGEARHRIDRSQRRRTDRAARHHLGQRRHERRRSAGTGAAVDGEVGRTALPLVGEGWVGGREATREHQCLQEIG